jgi:anti-anti-sigma factor
MSAELRDEPFGVAVAVDGPVTIISVTGELDLATIGELRDAIPAIGAGGRCVLDLSRVSFMDSTGVHLLMRLDVRARNQGWSLVVVRGPGAVSRVLEVCRVHERIQVVDDLASAS